MDKYDEQTASIRIAEYWNGLENHSAMLDACENAILIARAALKEG